MKRFLIFLVVFCTVFVFTAQTAFALTEVEWNRMQSYEGRFYMPGRTRPSNNRPPGGVCAGTPGDLNSPAPTALVGETNLEKAWNYLTARGLSPVAAAGVTGNIMPESGFDPFLHEAGGGGGWGIIQWTPASVFATDADYDIGDGTTDRPSSVAVGATSGDNDLYLLWQLHALWKRPFREGKPTFWEEMNQETHVGCYTTTPECPDGPPPSNVAPRVDGDPGQFLGADFYKGRGSAYFYHASSVRSGDRNWGLRADGTPNSSRNLAGVGWRGNILNRPFRGTEHLERFSGATQTPGCVDSSNWGDTNALVDQWRREMGRNMPRLSMEVWRAGNIQTESYQCADNTSGINNGCVAFSAWFVDRFTTARFGPGNGRDVASRTAQANGLAVTNSPVAPALFSSHGRGCFGTGGSAEGHTGVVLSVEGNTATVFHGWNGTRSWGPDNGHDMCDGYIEEFTFPCSEGTHVEFVNLGDFAR